MRQTQGEAGPSPETDSPVDSAGSAGTAQSPRTGNPLTLGIQLWLHSRAGGSGSWAALLGADVMRGKEMIDIPSPLATASSRSLHTQVTFSHAICFVWPLFGPSMRYHQP